MMNKGELAKYRMADRMREAEQARVANDVWAARARGTTWTARATAMLARALRPVRQAVGTARAVRHVAHHVV